MKSEALLKELHYARSQRIVNKESTKSVDNMIIEIQQTLTDKNGHKQHTELKILSRTTAGQLLEAYLLFHYNFQPKPGISKLLLALHDEDIVEFSKQELASMVDFIVDSNPPEVLYESDNILKYVYAEENNALLDTIRRELAK